LRRSSNVGAGAQGSVIHHGVALVAAAATAVALFIPWLPVAAGEEADRIHFVFWFTTAICIGVFAVVAAVLGLIWKFCVKLDDQTALTHGHTQLEIATAVPAVL
jgi:heme/copper-type cytochrome/quinol oxidase subunit 2